jgi:hypothetical protein
MRFTLGLGLATLVVGAGWPVWAHHSHGNYEDTFMDIYLEVKDPKGGDPQIWALEATGRPQLQKIGVTADYVKPGDTVKARCHHLRDGSNGCLLGFLKAKDGTVKDWDGNGAQLPTDF